MLSELCRAFLIVPALLVVVAISAYAGTFTVFGPKNYVRGTGAPVTVTDTFTVFNPSTQFTLKAFNGGLENAQTELVSSSIVTINGVQVLGPSNFNQNVSEIDVPVTLQASNTISVQVRGQPGGTLTIQIAGVDNEPPTIKATATPAPNAAGWNNTDVIVTFTCNDVISGVASCPPPQKVTTEGANQITSIQSGAFSCSLTLDPGPNTITAQARDVAGNVATQSESVTFTSGPVITGFTPTSGSIGTLITVTGTGFTTNGAIPVLSLNQQGGGSLNAPISSFSATSLSFVIPTGAATGSLSVSVGGQTATSSVPLAVTTSSAFTLTAAPSAASLIEGQSVGYVVSIVSTTGFSGLAALKVTGCSPVGSSILSVSASATVDGVLLSQTVPLTLNVVQGTTSFIGRTVVDDARETPVSRVTVTMLGNNGEGGSTGCTGSTVSDEAGNFGLTGLSSACVGPQLVGFDGLTAASPPGKYAGVNLVYTFQSAQVTASPVLVHLPRIDNQETFFVQQNSSQDQSHSYASIPGLSVTVYKGTTFTLPNGSQPNPFPLVAVEVPVDRLPDQKPPVPTMLSAFIVAFQPANAVASRPAAVFYPNTLNTPAGSIMPLMTLDPTRGRMIPYGTGTVSFDGTQIVPDPDPAFSGARFGIVHFDWHGAMPPPPPQPNPAPPGSGPGSGPGGPGGPGGGSGPGGGGSGGGNGGGGGGGGTGAGGGGDGGSGGDGGGGAGCQNPPVDVGFPIGIRGALQGPPMPLDQDRALKARESVELSSDMPTAEVRAALGGTPALLSENDSAEAGDPIDLSSGIQVITNTDIAINGSRGSIAITRTYRSLTSIGGPFGIGTNHNYGYALDTVFPQTVGVINLIMPDGNRFPFSPRVCPGGGSCGRTNTTIPVLLGAFMTVNSDNSVDIRWKNGTVYHFVPASFQFGSLLASITDRNGNTIKIVRNPTAPVQITQVTDPVGRSLSFAYDGSNRITSITDPIGRTVQYTYNSQGSVATFTDPAGGVTKYTYDANNNLLTVTDARGILQVQNTLDSNGRVIQQLRPDGGILTFAYGLLNPLAATSPALQAEVSDNLGVKATYRFNPLGFVTHVVATQGQTRLIDRAPGSNIVLSTTESTVAQTYVYDVIGNVLSSTDATGHTTQFTYDPVFNKVTSITDPLGNVTRFTYDGKGNLLTLTDANGNVTSYQYDPNGLLTQSMDALNQKTKFTYDAFGNLATATDPLANTTSYLYDGISRLLAVKDSLGRQTSFTYDPLGRLLTRTDAQGGATAFTYDPDGNLLSVKDARQNLTAFAYDSMNRLLTKTDPLGKTDTRTYDTNGNLVQLVDRRGLTSTFAFDNLNRLVSETYLDATVSRTYDVLGRLNQVTDSAAGVFSFAYDLAGRLTSSSTPFGTVNYTYDGRGLMASRQVAGQPALSYTYEPAGNLASAALPQASASFTYDARNQVSNISRLNGVSSTFGYDPDARLLSLTHAAGATAIDAESYTYDAVGNRTSHSTSIGQSLISQPTTNQFNVNNQLTQFGSVPDSYDANGNLVQEGSGATYTWDGRNRLKSIVSAAGQTTNFTYDFAGNMVRQADSGTSLNLTKTFVLDALTNVAYESASDGTSYSVLSGRTIDSHLAIAQSTGQIQYGLADAINSTVATTDQSGAIKSQFFYEPFGQTTTTATYPFQFSGRMPVSSTAYYYRARFYNAAAGRFIREDPIGFAGGINLYAYARGNPIKFNDPRGTAVTMRNPGFDQCVVTHFSACQANGGQTEACVDDANSYCRDIFFPIEPDRNEPGLQPPFIDPVLTFVCKLPILLK